jgi:GTP-binding protein Era
MKKKILMIAICGAPNAGKSTFLNKIVGEKVSIVSPKVQTTRNAIKGVVNFDNTQIIFTDTPGIFRARKDFSLEKRISGFAWKIIRSSSKVVLMIDGELGITKEVRDILQDFQKRKKDVIAVINKIDTLGEKEKLDLGLELESNGETISHIFYISSTTGAGIEKLTDYLKTQSVEGEWLYSSDEISDISLNMTASEVLREKIFLELKEEIPYHTSVVTEYFEENEEDIFIRLLVTVTKESQKIIMIGKRGANLKTIKHLTEEELTVIFGKKVTIDIFIRVRGDWREKEDYYQYMNI